MTKDVRLKLNDNINGHNVSHVIFVCVCAVTFPLGFFFFFFLTELLCRETHLNGSKFLKRNSLALITEKVTVLASGRARSSYSNDAAGVLFLHLPALPCSSFILRKFSPYDGSYRLYPPNCI